MASLPKGKEAILRADAAAPPDTMENTARDTAALRHPTPAKALARKGKTCPTSRLSAKERRLALLHAALGRLERIDLLLHAALAGPLHQMLMCRSKRRRIQFQRGKPGWHRSP